MRLTIINGPNLNLVGTRESNIYGCEKMSDFIEQLRSEHPEHDIEYHQSNVEGEIVTLIQQADGRDGIILNAGGYTHTSVAIADAVAAITTPTVEVHISNILAREPERHVSLLARAVTGSIMGFGLDSYRLAIRALELVRL